jgi:4-hydroxybenzoate polyprenyltransferase
MTVSAKNRQPGKHPERELRVSLPSRIHAYLGERFPLFANGLLILSFYSSNQFLAHALSQPGEPMRYNLNSVLGCLTVLCFFLHMRIFDDHKDYAADCRYFPNRILQRGTVTLRELKILAAFAIACEFLLASICGPAAFISLLAAFAYSVLMLKEFFVGDWLKKRFLLYASIHMLIMPLLAMTVWSFATKQYFWQIPSWYWLYSLVSYFLAFNWEISRKIRVPEDEVEGLDSYSRLFGTFGAAYLVLWNRVISTVLVAVVAVHLGLSIWFYVLLLTLFLACLFGFFQYRFQASAKTARRMEIYAAIYIVAFDLALAVELGRTFGIRISGEL